MSENKKREKRPIFTSPAGVARYPRLHTPDTKFDADGVYKIDLLLTPDAAKPLVAQVEKAMAESVEAAKKEAKGKKVKAADAPFSEITEGDAEMVKFSFKLKAKIKSKKTGEEWQQRPALFDAKGTPLVATVRVGGGSKVKVAFEINPFYVPGPVGAGVSLRLKAVQVLDLVEYDGTKNAGAFGFAAEEGYEGAEETAEETPATETPASPAAEGSEDF